MLKKFVDSSFFIMLVAALAATSAFSIDSETHLKTKVCGHNELFCADVELQAGKRRVLTDATITVEQILGGDPQATTWFYFGTTLEDANGIGAAGDTIRVQIPAAVTPIGTIYPAVDVTYTLVAGDISSTNPERTVAVKVCSALNANTNFINAKWKCTVARDFALVHIESKLFNEFGERTSWTLTCTGTTLCDIGYADVLRRNKPTELARSPNDPRRGILSISGTVATLPGAIGSRFQEYFKNGSSSNMLVDADPTAQTFTVTTSATRDIFVEQVRCFGGGNSIKFEQFMAQNIMLTNGLLFEIKSDNEMSSIGPIKVTEDFKNIFTTQGSDFHIDVQSAADQFIAIFRPTVSFPLRAQGSFGSGNDDYLRVLVRDDIDSVGSQLECQAWGFTKEP